MPFDKQAYRDRMREIEAFKADARIVMIEHVAPMLEHLVASPSCPLRFDTAGVKRLEAQLVRLMQAFVNGTHVDPRPDVFSSNQKVEEERFKKRAEKACERLEQSWPA